MYRANWEPCVVLSYIVDVVSWTQAYRANWEPCLFLSYIVWMLFLGHRPIGLTGDHV